MSFWRTYYHLVWATKNRESFIAPDIEDRLYAYLEKKAREIGVTVFALNGMPDHVHLIVSIPPKLSISQVVKRLKGASSHDLNQVGIGFTWQRGYGVLTLGERQRPIAEAYVRNQKKHHNEISTNGWLERMAEAEDGPVFEIQDHEDSSRVVRDEHGSYESIDEMPF